MYPKPIREVSEAGRSQKQSQKLLDGIKVTA